MTPAPGRDPLTRSPAIQTESGRPRVSGFTIARRAVDLGYPIQESLRSMLPVVDEVYVNVGDSDDGTWEAVHEIGDPKIRAFRSKWNLDRGWGLTLSEETNKALARCSGEWAVYLQADEVLHESDLPRLRAAMSRHGGTRVESFSLRYLHFYGTYSRFQDDPRRWYPRATRVVRLGIGVESVGDACAFMVREGDTFRAPRRRHLGVRVYHYGWVREPRTLVRKQANLDRLLNTAEWQREHGISEDAKASELLTDTRYLRAFRGTHPAVMHERVAAAASWETAMPIGRRPWWLWSAGTHAGWIFDWVIRRAAVSGRRIMARIGPGRRS